jgi:hypothetical protein
VIARVQLRYLALTFILTCIALYAFVYLHYRLPDRILLDEKGQARVVRYLRAAIQHQAPPAIADLTLVLPGSGWISLYSGTNSSLLLRHETEKSTLAQWLVSVRQLILQSPTIKNLSPQEKARLRIKVDLETSRGPIISSIPMIFAQSIVPGIDGLGFSAAGKTLYLLPDDLFARDLLAGYQPFFFMGEFRSGLDLKTIVNDFANRLELSSTAWRNTSKKYFRFRVQSFVESLDHQLAKPVVRSRVPVYPINRTVVQQAVQNAADYVLRQIRPDGLFEYIYYPLSDHHSPPGDYSLPRHAGTTWFLSLAYRILGQPRFKRGAQGAIEYLAAHAIAPACQNQSYSCIGNDHDADLGSAALGVVAIVEYQQATGDNRFEKLAGKLGQFILRMQKPDGDFCHQYTPSTKTKNCNEVLLYYSGEATFALAKLFQLTHDLRYAKPIEHALDYLTGGMYDFFLGQFFISEDHWTCIAAEAAFEVVNKDQYAHFCYEFAKTNQRAQVQPDDGLLQDLQGAFLITPFFTPHNTPSGSRTEANVATYLLSQKRGEPQPEILHTILLSVRYLVDQQLSREGGYLFPNSAAATGGMMQTPMRANIRIDFVQHAAAAMARSLPLVPKQWWQP